MPELKDPLDQAETGDITEFSKLEASIARTEVAQRPNSRSQNGVNRHAEPSDLFVNELDFDFDLGKGHYPLDDLNSLQQVFDAVQCHRHLDKAENFSVGTHVECLVVNSQGEEWLTLDEDSMDNLLQVLSSHPILRVHN